MRNALGCGIAVGILALASTAMAQEPTPPPTEPVVTPPPPPPPPPAKATVTVQTATPATDGDKPADDGTDHSKVVGHFGVGYFGITAQPIGDVTAAGTGAGATVGLARATVQVPVIGARYWLNERIGIDGGVGFNFFSSGGSSKTGGTETSQDGPAVIAFALHAGVPIAFATGKHYKFLAIPELNFGYATRTQETPNVPDIHFSGIRFDVGARVGTEIQFGFIGIPELALQASVGLNFRHRVYHATVDSNPEQSFSATNTDFGTTVQSDPWAIFTNNIAAIYYFP